MCQMFKAVLIASDRTTYLKTTQIIGSSAETAGYFFQPRWTALEIQDHVHITAQRLPSWGIHDFGVHHHGIVRSELPNRNTHRFSPWHKGLHVQQRTTHTINQ
mmetsp:Transcript_8809/g.15882  ORF Transcript_8809/g.15882 Transcript_8809/m.15882 type:complete len:103 (-) Transcript_8809:1269-1577(-)